MLPGVLKEIETRLKMKWTLNFTSTLYFEKIRPLSLILCRANNFKILNNISENNLVQIINDHILN